MFSLFGKRTESAPAAAASAGSAPIAMTVNGKAVSAPVEPRTLLVQFLREQLRLTGTHVGCDTSQCGACVVHVNGRAVKSCTLLAASCAGASGARPTWLAGADPGGPGPGLPGALFGLFSRLGQRF